MESTTLVETGTTLEVTAAYITSEEVRCILETTGLYSVSVFISETVSSPFIQFLAYDSVCLSYTGGIFDKKVSMLALPK